MSIKLPLRLGVNIDHVATLRNARGGAHPDPLRAAQMALANGADSITLHLREDRRHITDSDLERIRAEIDAPINLEMAATPEMLTIALKTKPHAACIVPERRAEVTTEGGLDAAGNFEKLNVIVGELSKAGIRVSLFIDPDPVQLRAAAALQAPVVELHTGAYAHAPISEIQRLRESAAFARALGIEVHAGHGLNFENVTAIAQIPEIMELNIGHFLIGEAIFEGLGPTIAHMRALMTKARQTG